MSVVDHAGAATDHLRDSIKDELAAALAPLVERASLGDRATLVSATVRMTWWDPLALFAAARATGEEAAIWLQPEAGFGLVAIGSAWSVRAAGADRFREVATGWSDVAAGAIVGGADDVPGAGPLLIGGFGFGTGDSRSQIWAGFEGARFDVPSLMVRVTPGSTWLTASVVISPHEAGAGVNAAAVGDACRRWATLAAGATSRVPLVPAAAVLRIMRQVPDAGEWLAIVARLAGAVGRGRLDKIVLARRVDLVSDGRLDVPAVIRRLEVAAPESTIYAFSRGGRTFLGASPERLARSEGREFRTVAMAGSIRRGADEAEDDLLAAELLASEKDREEQAVVVEMLRETLAPITDRLVVAHRPSVVRFRHIQHLATEVQGRLSERSGIAGLVERLHPTPAVGGAPRDLALELIADEERLERGWYAGPVGWIDTRGDGEFVVAIRSGVIEDDMASLFAGCGIVADSEPAREWAESQLKLQTLAGVLGTVET